MYLERIGIKSQTIELIAANVVDIALHGEDERVRLRASEILLNITQRSIEATERLKFAAQGRVTLDAFASFNQQLEGKVEDVKSNGGGDSDSEEAVGGEPAAIGSRETQEQPQGEDSGAKAEDPGAERKRRPQIGEHEEIPATNEGGRNGEGESGEAVAAESTENRN